MTGEAKASSTSTNRAEFLQLFGPPSVLSSESAQAYDEIMARLLASFAPRDFMEQMLIKELADCTWEIMRYTRHKTVLMERRLRQRLEFQAQRHKDAEERKDAPTMGLAEQNRAPPTSPEDVLEGLVEEVDAILLKSADERDHARALEVGIVYYERFDKLLATARARRNNVLDQIERYRDKFGQRLRRISDKIIEAEFTAVAAQPRQIAAPLVPSAEQQP